MDPIHAAIATARAANAHLIACCRALRDDDSEAAERACNAASDATTLAGEALALVHPTTPAGLIALVEHYADDADGSDLGALYLERLLAVMRPSASEWGSACTGRSPTVTDDRSRSQTKCVGRAAVCANAATATAMPRPARTAAVRRVVRLVMFGLAKLSDWIGSITRTYRQGFAIVVRRRTKLEGGLR